MPPATWQCLFRRVGFAMKLAYSTTTTSVVENAARAVRRYDQAQRAALVRPRIVPLNGATAPS